MIFGVDIVEESRKGWRTIIPQPVDPEHLVRPVVAFDASSPTADPRQTLRVFEPGFAGPEAFFHQLSFGQIEAGPTKSDELAVSVTGHAGVQDPTIFPVRAPQPEFYLERETGVKRRAVGADA